VYGDLSGSRGTQFSGARDSFKSRYWVVDENRLVSLITLGDLAVASAFEVDTLQPNSIDQNTIEK
jgi:hypothetical protein